VSLISTPFVSAMAKEYNIKTNFAIFLLSTQYYALHTAY